jgi:hypothetical protein
LEQTNTSIDIGDMISSGKSDIGDLVFKAVESCCAEPSEMGTAMPFSNPLSMDNLMLPLSLCLLLCRALSPISPVSDTFSLSISSSTWKDKLRGKLKEHRLTGEPTLLV